MARYSEFVSYVLELLEPMGGVIAKRMFGGYGIFRDGLMFGLVADNMLYFKVDDQNRKDYEDQGLEPFSYDRKGKQMTMSYYRAPEEALEDGETMIIWAEKSFSAALVFASNKKK